MSVSGAAARGILVTLAGQWTKFALQFLGIIILARLLEPSDFGIYAMVLVFSSLATLLGDFGLSLASMQSATATPAQRSNLLWVSIVLGTTLAVLLFFLADQIAALYETPAVAGVARAMSVAFLLQAVAGQFRAELARSLRFRWIALAEVLAQVIGLLVAVALAANGGGYWALVLQQLATSTLILFVVVVAARWIPGLPSRTGGMVPLIRFAARAGSVQLLNFVTSNVDTVVLGRVSGPYSTGLYAQAFQITKLPLTQVAGPLTQVAVPILARVRGTATLARYVGLAQSGLAYVLGGAMILLTALATPAVAIVLGPGWEGVPPIIAALAVGGFFQALGYLYYWLFLAVDLTAIQLRVAIVSRTLMVLAIVVGASWGPVGVALGGSLGLALNWLGLTLFALPKVGVAVRPILISGFRPLIVLGPVGFAAWGGAALSSQYGDVLSLILGLGCSVALGLCFLAVSWFRNDMRELIRAAKRVRDR